MHSVPPSGPGEPTQGQADSLRYVEARGRKRKRAGTPTATPADVEAAATPSKERLRLLSKLRQRRSNLDSPKSIWHDLLEVLQDARPRDLLWALLYSVHQRQSEGVDPGTSLDDEGPLSPQHVALEGLVGLDSNSSDVSLLAQLLSTELCKEPHPAEPGMLQMDPSSALHSVVQLVAHDSKQPADRLVLCPVFAHDTVIAAFLLLGVTLQSYDDGFSIFAQALSDCVSRSVSTCVLYKRLRDIQLASGELLRRAEEAERSNFMFRHMAESATVGCAIFDPSGRPMWLNEAYLNLTGVLRENFRPVIWQKSIVPEDLAAVEGRWNKLASGEPIEPFTFRVKRHRSPTATPGSCESLDYRWLLSNAYVDFNEDGSCRRVMGWLTDISAQKWNEQLQAQRLEDALETKRQTEKFIDMVRVALSGSNAQTLLTARQVSHEIRNPLSAIIQTADGVLTWMDQQKQDRIRSDIYDNIADSEKTIILCAHHQKRIGK